MRLMDFGGKLPELFKKYKFVLLVVAAGIILILLPTGGSGGKDKTESAASPEPYNIEACEKRLEGILSQGSGVGRVKVMLSLRSDMEAVYAKEGRASESESKGDSGDKSSDEEYGVAVVSDGSGGEAPVLIKNLYPEFLGAIIVCDGADNAATRLLITEAVTAATGIRSDNITVLKMKN